MCFDTIDTLIIISVAAADGVTDTVVLLSGGRRGSAPQPSRDVAEQLTAGSGRPTRRPTAETRARIYILHAPTPTSSS